jgi:hypothetical protein
MGCSYALPHDFFRVSLEDRSVADLDGGFVYEIIRRVLIHVSTC